MSKSLTRRVLDTVIEHYVGREFIASEVHREFYPEQKRETISQILHRFVKFGLLTKKYIVFKVVDKSDYARVWGVNELIDTLQKMMTGHEGSPAVYFYGVEVDAKFDEEGKLISIVVANSNHNFKTSKEENIVKWKCNECGKETERLLICWGESGGQKVDRIDWFCPHCSSYDLTFQGTKEEEEAYWAMEWKK